MDLGSWLIVISLILLFLAYLFYQSAEARLTFMETRIREIMQNTADCTKKVQTMESSSLNINRKLSDIKLDLDQEQKALDFIAQELIRVDRETAKLRPVIKLVIPKKKVPNAKSKNA